jgi:hypothetical protein
LVGKGKRRRKLKEIFFLDIEFGVLVLVDNCWIIGQEKQSPTLFVQSPDVVIVLKFGRKQLVNGFVVGVGFGDDVPFGFIEEKEFSPAGIRLRRGNNETFIIWKGDPISWGKFVLKRLDLLGIDQNFFLFDQVNDVATREMVGGLEIVENVHSRID